MRKLIFTLIFLSIIAVPILAEPIHAKGEAGRARARAAQRYHPEYYSIRIPPAADTDAKKFTFCSELKEKLIAAYNRAGSQIAKDTIMSKIMRTDACLNAYAVYTEVREGEFEKQKWIRGSKVYNPDINTDIYREEQ